MLVLKVTFEGTKINITFRMNDNIKHGVVMPNYRPRSRGLFTSVRVETRCRKVYGHFEFRNQTVIL